MNGVIILTAIEAHSERSTQTAFIVSGIKGSQKCILSNSVWYTLIEFHFVWDETHSVDTAR